MKIKLFLILLSVGLFCACSSDSTTETDDTGVEQADSLLNKDQQKADSMRKALGI